MLGDLGMIFNPLTLSIGVLTLRWDDSRAARWIDLIIQWHLNWMNEVEELIYNQRLTKT